MPISAAQRDALRAANDRTKEWVERRINDDAENIARLYKSSRDTLVNRLNYIYQNFLQEELDPKTKKMVGPSLVSAKSGPGLSMLRRAVDEEVGKLTNQIARDATDRLSATRKSGKARIAKQELAQLPEETRYVLNELTTSTQGGGTFWDRLDHMSDKFKSELHSNIRQGLLNQETFDEVRQRVMKQFGVDKLAAPKGPAYSSVMVHKNEARRQWNLLQKDIARDQDAWMVWWAEIDEDSTPGCLARHGYLIDTDLDGELPPRHINCRCTVAVFEPGTDLEVFRAEAEAQLAELGYDVDEAWAEESAHQVFYRSMFRQLRESRLVPQHPFDEDLFANA